MEIKTITNITTILSNISTFIGVIVSIVAICITIKQSKDQYKISQYKNRKETYDFLKEFKDNWLFYIDCSRKSNTIEKSFFAAMNGFADNEKKVLKSSDFKKIIHNIMKYYNIQYEKLNEITIYYKLSEENKKIISEILSKLELYFYKVLKYAEILEQNSDSDKERILTEMDLIVDQLYKLLEADALENIINIMKKEISIR